MANPAGGDGHGFTFLSHIPGVGHDVPVHIVGAVIVTALLFLGTWVARLQLNQVRQGPDEGVVPPRKLTFYNFFEIAAEQLFRFTESVIGKAEAPRYYPLIGTLFLFIFTCNLMGLIPGFLPPTDNLNTTLALGTVVFIYYNAIGIKAHGWGYIKHFMGPVWFIAPLMLVIELISHIVRPISLALRLRGNIFGDHLVLSVFSDLVPYGVPIVFMAFGLFVAFIQSFVFTLLTMVYISLATAHDH